MTPMHLLPGGGIGIVLVEDMVSSIEEAQSVRIVDPSLPRGEMKRRASHLGCLSVASGNLENGT